MINSTIEMHEVIIQTSSWHCRVGIASEDQFTVYTVLHSHMDSKGVGSVQWVNCRQLCRPSWTSTVCSATLGGPAIRAVNHWSKGASKYLYGNIMCMIECRLILCDGLRMKMSKCFVIYNCVKCAQEISIINCYLHVSNIVHATHSY